MRVHVALPFTSASLQKQEKPSKCHQYQPKYAGNHVLKVRVDKNFLELGNLPLALSLKVSQEFSRISFHPFVHNRRAGQLQEDREPSGWGPCSDLPSAFLLHPKGRSQNRAERARDTSQSGRKTATSEPLTGPACATQQVRRHFSSQDSNRTSSQTQNRAETMQVGQPLADPTLLGLQLFFSTKEQVV